MFCFDGKLESGMMHGGREIAYGRSRGAMGYLGYLTNRERRGDADLETRKGCRAGWGRES